MNRAAVLAFLLLGACGPASSSPKLDANHPPHDGPVDTSVSPDAFVPVDTGPDSNQPYRHAIVVDGVDDFATVDKFGTTSPAYGAMVAWDATNLYLGYTGPDLAAGALDAAQKWLFVYIDTDPGASTGAATSVLYRTQRATFPTGFGAELHARWKADGSFHEVATYNGTTWVPTAVGQAGHATDVVELSIPRANLGAGPIGVVTWMINEKDLAEASYAGLYAGNFTDGYAANLALTKYLRVDFDAPQAPIDPTNVRP